MNNDNNNKGLSNDDFRSLIEKKPINNSNNNSSSNNNKKNNNNKTKWLDRDYEYYQNAPEKKNDPNYLDRARERRTQNTDEGQNQIKKGLDFELLQNTKEKLNLDNKQNQHHQKDQKYQSEIDKIKNLKHKTQLGSSMIKTLANITADKSNDIKKKQQIKNNKEIFQTNRMLYLFDLDPVFPQLIPTTIMNSKEDCPKVKETISGRLDTNILKRIIGFYHPEKEIQIVKQSINGNGGIGDDSIFSDSDKDEKEKENSKKVVVIQKQDDSDSDSDIFSDAEDYVCEVNKSTTTTTTETQAKSHHYFKNKEDYSDEFKPIGKEGDENDHNDIYDVPRPPQLYDEEEEEDEYTYPNTDDNYNKQYADQDEEGVYDIPRPPQEDDEEGETIIERNQPMQNDDDDDDDQEDEYAYPNTDENYEQHEKDYMQEQERRLNESSSSDEENDIISLDTNNEKLKRKLMDTYGDDDIYPQFEGFERERGEKINIDEMYKFKKPNSNKDSQRSDEQKKKQKLNKDMNRINQIMKKNSKESGTKHYDLFEGSKKNKK
ncbi:hypothetical protein DICPUDRAFT_87612 [Dictyostelium purpureum]|uniref:RED-like N-terminal domain-containing protein n=1 Tax=Dictyostelium purpureum TaxID=5786 RepID=F0ZJ79_DICPU|nr:uncharacterized protein DICPUDRAFT_87612 [Dictyostelium purpureum]EGC35972.1 hypothetical protein DICPUDRAFT_87612 [Dictyostelium purpureum]|eukprot:XP_003287473.1 hypothetical protein DICPUDRAFT_87612 [Dictyostelium purpureum]